MLQYVSIIVCRGSYPTPTPALAKVGCNDAPGHSEEPFLSSTALAGRKRLSQACLDGVISA